MVTIKDIAQEAGVSAMMVSRVINKRYNQVSAENIERIEAIIKKHNYIPNSAAQSLSSKSSKIIAIFIQGNANSLGHPYNATMLGSLIQDVQAYGYNTMVHFISNYSEVCNKLQSWKACGAIFLGIFEKDFEQFPFKTDVPFVFTDCYCTSRQISNVGIDNYKGGVLAAQHLLGCGHSNFATIGEYLNESPLIRERLNGFRDTLSQAGFELGADRIVNCDSYAVQKLIALRGEHLAIFGFSDIHSLKTMKQLNELGYQVPEDFSIIGFDDLYLCQLTNPELTTISQNITEKSKFTVDLLFQYLKYPELPSQNITLDVKLVSRSTVKKITPFSSPS